jgi:hypothetical protein
MMTLELPIRTQSEANLREHWAVRKKRAKSQRGTTAAACQAQLGTPPAPPMRVTLTRIAPCRLDDDNLAISFKHVRDGIADWLGINDRDQRIEWRYAQQKGAPKTYAVRLEIEPLSST